MNAFATVDLGAARGRVMRATVADGVLDLAEVHRFRNRPVRAAGTLYWDILGLYGNILDGLGAAGPDLHSIGITSWPVDYGLLDGTGMLLGNPVHYRDGRTDGIMHRVLAGLSHERFIGGSGVRSLPFDTVYQLVAASRELHRAESMLLVPDLIAYWLTGELGAELTNASTTGLLDLHSRGWAYALMDRLGLPERLFAPIWEPGETIGELLPEVLAETGLPERLPVTAVASHDTASAVTAVPASDESFAYISCDAWSEVGVELAEPVIGPAVRAAGFTNELGIDGTVRFARNITGLWPLQEALRNWGGPPVEGLLAEAAALPALRSVVDLDTPEFLPPGDMPARITAQCRATGQQPPARPAEFVRCIVDSLALAHRKAVRRAAELTGHRIEVIHMVGAGARNDLMCRLTADACGLPVIAGPVEATALGNALIQAGAFGVVKDLSEMRALVTATQPLRRHEPRTDERAWDRAAARLRS